MRRNAAVVEVLTAWMQGHVSEDAHRHALTVSGELDRWDAVTLGAKDRERLDDAMDVDRFSTTRFNPLLTGLLGHAR